MVDPKLFALVTAVCFGLNPMTLKLGFRKGGSPDTAMILGLAIAVPLYLVLLPLSGGLHLELLTTAALVGFVLGGLFGTGIGRRWLYIAIDRIGASPATAIKNSAPVITRAPRGGPLRGGRHRWSAGRRSWPSWSASCS